MFVATGGDQSGQGVSIPLNIRLPHPTTTEQLDQSSRTSRVWSCDLTGRAAQARKRQQVRVVEDACAVHIFGIFINELFVFQYVRGNFQHRYRDLFQDCDRSMIQMTDSDVNDNSGMFIPPDQSPRRSLLAMHKRTFHPPPFTIELCGEFKVNGTAVSIL